MNESATKPPFTTIPSGDANVDSTAPSQAPLCWPVASAVAAAFALLGFVVAIVAGVSSGRLADSTLVHAIVALACCWPVGWIAGKVIESQLGGASRRAQQPERADKSPTFGSGALPEAGVGDRTRAIVGTIGPEENPTMRQEVRPRSRST